MLIVSSEYRKGLKSKLLTLKQEESTEQMQSKKKEIRAKIKEIENIGKNQQILMTNNNDKRRQSSHYQE